MCCSSIQCICSAIYYIITSQTFLNLLLTNCSCQTVTEFITGCCNKILQFLLPHIITNIFCALRNHLHLDWSFLCFADNQPHNFLCIEHYASIDFPVHTPDLCQGDSVSRDKKIEKLSQLEVLVKTPSDLDDYLHPDIASFHGGFHQDILGKVSTLYSGARKVDHNLTLHSGSVRMNENQISQ